MTDLSAGRILVTGGAGFIGSALVWELNHRGIADILITDRLGRSEKWKNLAPLRFADYIEADDLLSRSALGGCKVIFHLGACSSTAETDVSYLIRNNFEYTKWLATYALEHNVRFVYASSAATYGAAVAPHGEQPLHSLRPLNAYGYSKHLFDLYAHHAGLLPHITGLKYFNVYGPNEHHKGSMRSVVHKAFEQISQTGRMSLFKSYRPGIADGQQRRDFIYVKDAVRATLHLAEHADGGGLFDIGTGEPQSWVCLAQAVFAALDRAPEIEFIEMPQQLRARYQYYTCADVSRLLGTGYRQPFYSIEDGVREYVRDYLLPGRQLDPDVE